MNIALFEAIADLLIPAGADMPSASQANAGTTGLARVLEFRPELRPVIQNILKQCEAVAPAEALATLDAASTATLAEIVASAYFMNETVRSKLNYHGQRPHSIVPEEIDAALLKPVIERGPIYRPTR